MGRHLWRTCIDLLQILDLVLYQADLRVEPDRRDWQLWLAWHVLLREKLLLHIAHTLQYLLLHHILQLHLCISRVHFRRLVGLYLSTKSEF